MNRRWKFGLVGGGVLAAVTTAVVVVVQVREARGWHALVARVDAARDRVDQRPAPRPVLWGEARDGDAFPAYRRAAEEIESIHAPYQEVKDHRKGIDSFVDPATATDEAWQVVQRMGPVWEAVHAGAHCRQARRPLDWSEGSESTLVSAWVVRRYLGRYLRMEVWARHRDGEAAAATQLFLDGIQFAADHASDPQVIVSGIGLLALDDLLGLFVHRLDPSPDHESPQRISRVDLATLPPEARALLARGLARADRSWFRPAMSYDTTLAEVVRLVTIQTEAGKGVDLRTGWRVGFSETILLCRGLRQLLEHGRRVAAGPEGWAIREVLDACTRDVKDSSNSFVVLAAPNIRPVLDAALRCRLRLRVVRMILAELEGHPEVLDDPTGSGLIRRRSVDGEVRYGSPGEDRAEFGR